MDVVVYSVDDAIDEFFAIHPSVTQQQCDEYAVTLVGGDSAHPVKIQGSFSYTVISGPEQSKIVQFRAPDSDLDREILDLAQKIHGEVVPRCTFHGSFCQLSVYVMDVVPGKPYGLAESRYRMPTGPSLDTGPQYCQTVTDYARFFAAAWKQRQDVAPDALQAIHDDYQWRFDYLSRALPPRFQGNLEKVRQGLGSLFTPSYRQALNHGDLSGTNIFVDHETGHITGIIDWAEAKVSPFGMSLWGLENVLGYMDEKGWHYLLNHEALRDLFWQTFEEEAGGLLPEDRWAMDVARMTGLFLQYGFNWGGSGRELVEEKSSSFAYLGAFCADGD